MVSDLFRIRSKIVPFGARLRPRKIPGGENVIMLTRKQCELLIYIDSYLKRTGYSPSFEEMKEALQLKSKSGIHRLISALEERNYLGRRHHRARALEVLRLPDNMMPRQETVLELEEDDDEDSPRFTPNVIRGDF